MRLTPACGIALLGCALSLGGGGPARAQSRPDVFALHEQLTPFTDQVKTVLDSDYARFRETLRELVHQEARQRGLRGEIGFSFSGSEAGDFSGVDAGNDSLFTIRAAGELIRGTYPSQLRVLADAHGLIRNNTLEQDLTRLRLSYGYQQNDHVGAFAFVQRYTDDFMSIESRYELGAGVSFGVDLGRRRSDERRARALAHLRSEGTGGFGCAVHLLRERFHPGTASDPGGCRSLSNGPTSGPSSVTGPSPTPTAFDGLHTALPHLHRALVAQEAWVSLRLGIGVFSEFESALIETRVSEFEPAAFLPPAPGMTPEMGDPDIPLSELPLFVRELTPRNVRIPAMQRYRLLLRPTIRVQPLSMVSINFVPTFKLPISNPRKYFDGELAYRMDWFVRIDWGLSENRTGDERIKLFVKLDYFKNMAPPFISDELVAEAALEHVIYHRTIATKKHRVVSLGVAIGLG